MPPACLITGVAGFVGSHLAERLLNLGHAIVGVDNFFSGHPGNLTLLRNNPLFTFYEADIVEAGLIEKLKRNHPEIDRCFHLAAIVSVPYSLEHPEKTMEINCRVAVRLLEDAARSGFNAFVFAGSAAEYGDDQRTPLTEAWPDNSTRHLSPYGRAKYVASSMVANNPIGKALRFFNIYGPRQDPSSPYSGVISRFIDMAANDRPLTIFGDGLQSRDFIYVSDVVEAYIRAAGLNGATSIPHGVYNVGTGMSTSILELAHAVQDVFGSNAGIEFLPERAGDIRHSLADAGKFQKAAGWNATVALRDGLKKTAQIL